MFEDFVNVPLTVAMDDERDVLGWWKGHCKSFPLLAKLI